MVSIMNNSKTINISCQEISFEQDGLEQKIDRLLDVLQELDIHHVRTNGVWPKGIFLHDKAAIVPQIIISPRSERDVAETLRWIHKLDLYDILPVSVKSGGHGYFNGATCSGIMMNMTGLDKKDITGNTMMVEPGCILGQIVPLLAKHQKAVPHGDCFGVGAGGHFITAGWDMILGRRYGLGCQSVTGARLVLWNGSVVDIEEGSDEYQDLLYAIRGGAAAGVGIITQIRLRLIEEPPRATWTFTYLNKAQLDLCIANKAFERAENLPTNVSVAFRVFFEPHELEPICNFIITSLLSIEETIEQLTIHLGSEVTSLVLDRSRWNEKKILDVRMIPASDEVRKHPEMLEEITAEQLHDDPMKWWQPEPVIREMASSYFTSISYWVKSDCDNQLADLYRVFETKKHDQNRGRMYCLVVQGGGRMTELQYRCSMPLGKALARFEFHWDDAATEETDCRDFTRRVENVLLDMRDPVPSRSYRGDIWLKEQASDSVLDSIAARYDRRSKSIQEVTATEVAVDVTEADILRSGREILLSKGGALSTITAIIS